MSDKCKMIIAMSTFGTVGIFVKYIPLPSSEIALYRAVLAVLLIGTYLFIKKEKIPFSNMKKQFPLLVISGMAIGVNWVLLFEAYKYTSVSIATLSYYFAPVIIIIASPLLFHETLTKKQIFCFVMCTLGMILLMDLRNLNMGSTTFIGILFGLGAAIFYASVVLLNKFIDDVNGIHRTLIQFISAIVILVPYIMVSGGTHLEQLDTIGMICLLIVGFIHTGVMYCVYFSSLKKLPGQVTSILGYLDPLIAVVLSVCLLHESITFIQIIGGIFILGFTYLNDAS